MREFFEFLDRFINGLRPGQRAALIVLSLTGFFSFFIRVDFPVWPPVLCLSILALCLLLWRKK
jgi:hypothetical protein